MNVVELSIFFLLQTLDPGRGVVQGRHLVVNVNISG